MELLNNEKIENEKALAPNTELTDNITESISNQNQIPVTISNEETNRKSEFEKYKQILESTNKYQIKDKQLVMISKGYNAMSNFIVIPKEKITYTNDVDINVKYKLKAIYLEDESIILPEIEVTLKEFNTFKFIIGSEWDKYCIVQYGNSNYNKLREVAQILGRYTMIERKVYTHTGFKEIEGKKVYLYNGGAIDETGDVKGISADLSQDELQDYAFTNANCDKKESIKTSYSILKLADENVIIPMVSTLYTSPLQGILESVGIYTDNVLFLVGKTGTRKSSISALLLNHYGEGFNKDHLPASFKDTANNLEKKAYVLKDSLIVVDNFTQEAVGNRKLDTLEKLLGIFGDHQGRGRMKPDGQSLRKAFNARSMAIISAEIVPPNLSEGLLARSFIVNIKQDTVNLDILTELQENKEKLAVAMKEYIKWVIKNEQKIKEQSKEKMKLFRQLQNNELHGRTNDCLNVMKIGFSIFLEFLRDNEIITIDEQADLNNKAEAVLNNNVIEQQREVQNVDPVEMFYNAIEELINIDKICLLDYATGEPLIKYSKGQIVGFIDKKANYYYFYQNTIYKVVENFYGGKSGAFAIGLGALLKQLDNKKVLFKNDKTRKTVLRTDPITHEKVKVIAVEVRAVDYDDKNTNIVQVPIEQQHTQEGQALNEQ